MKKIIVALLLSVIMIFSLSTSAFAISFFTIPHGLICNNSPNVTITQPTPSPPSIPPVVDNIANNITNSILDKAVARQIGGLFWEAFNFVFGRVAIRPPNAVV